MVDHSSGYAVDGDDNGGLWLSIPAIADLKGRSRQAIWKRVVKLEARGLLSSRVDKDGVKQINLAEYDKAVGQVSDLSKDAGERTKRLAGAPSSAAPLDGVAVSYTTQQARRMGYMADAARLDLEARLGKLLPADDLRVASGLLVEALVRLCDGLHLRAEDNASAVARDGVAGSRAWLRQLGVDMRNRIAAEVAKLVVQAAAARSIEVHEEEELMP